MQESFTLIDIYKVLQYVKERIPVDSYVSFYIDEKDHLCIRAGHKERFLQKIFLYDELCCVKDHSIFIEEFIENFIYDIKQYYKNYKK